MFSLPLHPSPRSLCANRSRWRTIGRTSRRAAMPIIDVQVHSFDRNHPGRPWASPSHGLASATGEEMVAAMNSVGVDGAIMVSSFSAYEYDPSYALEVYNAYPDKFRVVTPVDATDPAIDDVVRKWAATPGARGIRIRMRDGLPNEAQVDVICPNGLRTWEEIEEAIRLIPGPVVPLIPAHLSPYPSFQAHQDAGAAAAWFPALTTMAGLQPNWDFLSDFQQRGTLALDALRAEAAQSPWGVASNGRILDEPRLRAMEEKYLPD